MIYIYNNDNLNKLTSNDNHYLNTATRTRHTQPKTKDVLHGISLLTNKCHDNCTNIANRFFL